MKTHYQPDVEPASSTCRCGQAFSAADGAIAPRLAEHQARCPAVRGASPSDVIATHVYGGGTPSTRDPRPAESRPESESVAAARLIREGLLEVADATRALATELRRGGGWSKK